MITGRPPASFNKSVNSLCVVSSFTAPAVLATDSNTKPTATRHRRTATADILCEEAEPPASAYAHLCTCAHKPAQRRAVQTNAQVRSQT
mmetsp:Transcript_88339/g.152978  ORF Transcript_88339/g.152978 Transcript_88339/m.152978 type:complete len:89 (+) Transcript_88339:1836-2102(+)